MSPIEKLTESFLKFPGIGIRQARRFVYFLLHSDAAFAEELATLIRAVRSEVSRCPSCLRFHEPQSSASLCVLCENPHADRTLLLVVEKDDDLEAVRRGGAYNGRYFVLGGLLTTGSDKKPNHVKDAELVERVARDGGIREVILAFGANPDGDSTVFYLKRELTRIAEKRPLCVTALGRGISTGTEIEYSDAETLSHALGNRKSL